MTKRLGRASLLAAFTLSGCDPTLENVGVTGDGDRDDVSMTAGGARAGGVSEVGTGGRASSPNETCPESEPVEGERCALDEPDTDLSGPRCVYNVQCQGECCPYDEYTCQGGLWDYFYSHCDGPAPPPLTDIDPTVEDGGVAWCTVQVDGRDADPCYLLCARRQLFGCPGELSPEMCRDACDAALVSASRVDDSCVGLRCAYLSCLASAAEPTCSASEPCPEERSDYDGTCRPTR